MPTGGINVKGKGMMNTYLWEYPRGSMVQGSDTHASASATTQCSNVIDPPSTRMRKLLLLHNKGRMSEAPLMKAYYSAVSVQRPFHTVTTSRREDTKEERSRGRGEAGGVNPLAAHST